MTKEELQGMSIQVLKEQVALYKTMKSKGDEMTRQDTRDFNRMQRELWKRSEVA